MKIIRTIIPVLCALILFSCADNSQKEIVFEYDECGVVNKINPDEKCVWLVFTAHYSLNDNGYFENFDGVVPVLNTLKEKEVKGSFFPTGICFEVEKYQEAVRRIIDEGHYLSSHSFNHLLLCDEGRTLVSADSIKADFALMEASLEKYGLTKEQYHWLIPLMKLTIRRQPMLCVSWATNWSTDTRVYDRDGLDLTRSSQLYFD